jgi:hypothetical protein
VSAWLAEWERRSGTGEFIEYKSQSFSLSYQCLIGRDVNNIELEEDMGGQARSTSRADKFAPE